MKKDYYIRFEDSTLEEQVKRYFYHFGKESVYFHTLDVVKALKSIPLQRREDKPKRKLGALLHDVGRVVETDDLAEFCESNGKVISTEERRALPILHQFASRYIAEIVFGVDDLSVLNAIECHTTLKSNPSDIEKAVFIADKISWHEEPYQQLTNNVKLALERSIDDACFFYQENLHKQREQLSCYHPWSQEAYIFFLEQEREKLSLRKELQDFKGNL